MSEDKYENEGDISEWNPAIWKMRRLGQLNDRLHEYRLNPKIINIQYQDYNYQLWIKDLKNLYLEIYPKLTSNEKTKIENIKNAIEEALVKFPVHKLIKKINGMEIYWDDAAWQVYLRYIEIFEKLLLGAADIHGLDSPTKGESSLF